MITTHQHWTIEKLSKSINAIEFPEFQREPTVWSLEKKQRLIDSILRDFDISSIYFSRKENGGYDCIDGRQRINAIMSFLGLNDKDEADNGYHTKIINEIYDDGEFFDKVDSKRFNKLTAYWQNKILNYQLNIVEIQEVGNDDELNLQFLRLQIASVLNAGEKLHAMTGELRDLIFCEIIKHKYFEGVKIPRRRYAREQVAAQIALNFLSRVKNNTFQSARYVDLQDFFKQYSKISPEDKVLIKKMKNVYDEIITCLADKIRFIKNRAMAVSVFLFANELIMQNRENEIERFGEFLIKLLKTLKWQLPKGIKMDEAYQDLLKFQTSITQAASEKYSVIRRNDFLNDYYYHYANNKLAIKGDAEYRKTTGNDPNKDREKTKL
ncbi:MAG: DUF262 domain-containing protein [Deltaproteobacteria bacterium]|nr:DUF262 domain-containing protein [Deltaproteobacteria bacterium]